MKYKSDLERAFARGNKLSEELPYIWLIELDLIVILVVIILF